MSSTEAPGDAARGGSSQSESAAGASGYLLAGQASELERLQLQARVWEPSGRRLLEEIGDGSSNQALDVGCGALGWLRVLSEWVGSEGEVTGLTSTRQCFAQRTGSSPRRGFGTSTS